MLEDYVNSLISVPLVEEVDDFHLRESISA